MIEVFRLSDEAAAPARTKTKEVYPSHRLHGGVPLNGCDEPLRREELIAAQAAKYARERKA